MWTEGSINESSDCWSLGCLLFELCNKKIAFPSPLDLEVKDNELSLYKNEKESVYTIQTFQTAFKKICTKNISNKNKRMLKILNKDYQALLNFISGQNGRIIPSYYSDTLNYLLISILQPEASKRPSLINVIENLNQIYLH